MNLEDLARDIKDLRGSVALQKDLCISQQAVVTPKRLKDVEDAVTTLGASMAVAKMKWGAVQLVGQALGTVVGGTIVGLVVHYTR